MSGFRVKLDMDGIRAVLNDDAVVAEIERRGMAVAAEANAKARAVWPTCNEDPYVFKSDRHTNVPAAHVWTKTKSKSPKSRGCEFLNNKYGILASSIDAASK